MRSVACGERELVASASEEWWSLHELGLASSPVLYSGEPMAAPHIEYVPFILCVVQPLALQSTKPAMLSGHFGVHCSLLVFFTYLCL